MLEMPELDMVVLGLRTTCIASDAGRGGAGKHVVCEKPLCLNLSEADRMIEACRRAGVKLMYAKNSASRRNTCGSSNCSTAGRWVSRLIETDREA